MPTNPYFPSPAGYLTITQAAGALDISRQRVHVLIREHGLVVTPGGTGTHGLITIADLKRLRARTKGTPGRPRRSQTSA